MLETLRQRGYDPDLILTWKRKQLQHTGRRDCQDESQDEGGNAAEEQDEERDKDGGSVHYNYLLGMSLCSLTMERKDDLLKKRDEKRQELEVLHRKSPENLWEEDLDAFSAKLDEVEQAQRDEKNSTGVKTTKGSKGGRSKHRQQRKAPQRAHPRKKHGAAAKPKQRDATGDEGDTDFV